MRCRALRIPSLFVSAFAIALVASGCEHEPYHDVTPAQDQALSAALDDLDAMFEPVGVALAIRTADGAQWIETRGTRDGVSPLEDDALARFGSITKTFTAALIVQLADEGALSLDEPISQWSVAVPNAESTTVRHLLTHTSGLFNYTDDEEYLQSLDARPREAEEIFAVARTHGSLFSPGDSWFYSNTGYIALGFIAERVTGQPLEVELRQRFLGPLGLDDTGLADRDVLPRPLVRGYGPAEDGGRDLTERHDLTAQGPDGALFSSLEDMLDWSLALYGGDLLEPSSLEAMVTPGSAELLEPVVQAYGFQGGGYGLGAIVLHDAALGPVWGHAGNIAGYGAFVGYVPSIEVAFATYVTLDGADGIAAARRVVDALIAFEHERISSPLQQSESLGEP